MTKLPLTLNPDETFQITIFGNLYNMRQLWNTLGFWTLSIRDENGESLVLGIKLVTGIFLLKQYPQIRFDIKSESVLADPIRSDLNTFVFEVTDKDV